MNDNFNDDFLNILVYPSPMLKQTCREVSPRELLWKKFDPVEGSLHGMTLLGIPTLLSSMRATMNAVGGVGLAAPQVGLCVRIFVAKIGGETISCINPVLDEMRGKTKQVEGCLSLPGAQLEVERADSLILRGCDGDGKPFERQCEGMDAWVCQHEVDHLDGITILERVGPSQRFLLRHLLSRLESDYEFMKRRSKERRKKK